MTELSEKARIVRNKYQLEYRKRNRQKQKEYHKNWRAKNPDKAREYNKRYWENKAVTDNATDKLTVTDNRNNVICINCGELFTPKRSDARYCASSCRVAYNRKLKTK